MGAGRPRINSCNRPRQAQTGWHGRKQRLAGLGGSIKGWLAWATQNCQQATHNKQQQRHKGQSANNAQQSTQTGNLDFGARMIPRSVRPRVRSNMHQARAYNKLQDMSDRMIWQGHGGNKIIDITKLRGPSAFNKSRTRMVWRGHPGQRFIEITWLLFLGHVWPTWPFCLDHVWPILPYGKHALCPKRPSTMPQAKGPNRLQGISDPDGLARPSGSDTA